MVWVVPSGEMISILPAGRVAGLALLWAKGIEGVVEAVVDAPAERSMSTTAVK
jgi:hypothetical protein